MCCFCVVVQKTSAPAQNTWCFVLTHQRDITCLWYVMHVCPFPPSRTSWPGRKKKQKTGRNSRLFFFSSNYGGKNGWNCYDFIWSFYMRNTPTDSIIIFWMAVDVLLFSPGSRHLKSPSTIGTNHELPRSPPKNTQWLLFTLSVVLILTNLCHCISNVHIEDRSGSVVEDACISRGPQSKSGRSTERIF